jgi:death-on-curing protein
MRYPSLAEYLWLAEPVTGIEAAVLSKAARIDLPDSVLHAPSAGFGGQEFYPEVIDKGAVLTCRLAWNHPLPRWEQECCMGRARPLPRSQRDRLVAGPA